ncbi:beta-galactosidase [Paenibacillus glycanilyticus]|uniref:beta-galactosidase n=1 Tax=Paenibacillus glycanilyticus TaxID=126569 RepID=UPI002041EF71|nr:beta-galactosidase [Paenibacillus glycanilyticus]MCM3630607.1 beta-galactosidase [Paenibacillus glycanilyticus]
MSLDTQAISAVQFDADAVRIHGEPKLLLSASLFYFRIPRLLWKERMEQLKAYGYNSIDVYFPWNYHELREGEWDFTGERDVKAFLSAAREAGLWVIARPGPYICSEWDGGALPAYLFAQGIEIRQNDPVFLSRVAGWFDRIIPLLKAYQAGEGGTVIAVQLDNELDFYDCKDPEGYIGALRDLTLAHGISVPLFACAGQGGLLQAAGIAEGVAPTCNFYPDNRDPEFEQKVLHYGGLMEELGYPLLVTETNRAHYLLRRLLGCGAKLLGPYLQVSGTDFGFTNATNNWGKPLAFMTSDYDFGGMISPEGHIRPEAYEGRMLGRLTEAYGSRLAEAKAVGAADNSLSRTGQWNNVAGPYVLELKDGGQLLFLTNLDDEDKEIAIAGSPSFILRGGCSLALPHRIPLTGWGLEGTLEQSTAELYFAKQAGSKTALAFHTESAGQIQLNSEAIAAVETENGEAELRDGMLRIKFDGTSDAVCRVNYHNGTLLTIVIHNKIKALYMDEMDEVGTGSFGSAEARASHEELLEVEIWQKSSLDGAVPMSSPGARQSREQAAYLEQCDIYRGYAWYEATVPPHDSAQAEGVLIKNGSDVISLYVDGHYAGTTVPGGSSSYLPLKEGLQSGKLVARTEIWGHSNFDDSRLPGLKLHSLKGLTGMTLVTKQHELSRNWSVYRAADRTIRQELTSEVDRKLWPVVNLGGWLSPDHPAFEYYRKSFTPGDQADSWTIYFEGMQSMAKVFVDGNPAGDVYPFDPYLDLSSCLRAGQQAELAIFLERVIGLPAGRRAVMYEGVKAADWIISGAEEPELLAHADAARSQSQIAELPVQLEPGQTAWLYSTIQNSDNGKGWRAFVSGSGLKLTVFLEGRLVGRIWTPSEEGRPVITGGSQESVYLPGAWFEKKEGEVAILLEAVDQAGACRLEAIRLQPV